MIANTHLTRQYNVMSQTAAPRQPNLGNKNRMGPNITVVGDLNLIINLGPFPDDGFPKVSTVNAGVDGTTFSGRIGLEQNLTMTSNRDVRSCSRLPIDHEVLYLP